MGWGSAISARSQIERLGKWDSGKLSYISLHDPRVAELCPDLTHEQLMDQIWVLTSDRSSKFGGADAAKYLSRRLPKCGGFFRCASTSYDAIMALDLSPDCQAPLQD